MSNVLGSFVARGAFDITPNDDADLPTRAFTVYVGGAGDLHYLGDDGEEDTVTLSAGQIWPVIVKRVYEDSTATLIKGFKAYVA
jgi:hypothetical protein